MEMSGSRILSHVFTNYDCAEGRFRVLGIGLELACNGGLRKMSLAFEKIPRISLTCKLVPVLNREYENGLFNQKSNIFFSKSDLSSVVSFPTAG